MNRSVSIIIPCYNAEKWLAATLASAIGQTWPDKEIIVVDDGSKDNSLAVAKSFESPLVKVISQENRGASAARNRALQEARGDFIQYLDADDLLAPDKIELMVLLLSSVGNANCVAAGEWARFFNSPTEATFMPEAVWNDMSPVDWLICSWEGGGMMHPAAWLVPRAVASAAGGWNETLSLNDDGEYFCRVVLASAGVKFCSGAKSYYRSGLQGNLSSTTSRTGWESAFLACAQSTEHLLAKENSPRCRHASATLFQRFIYNVYPESLDLVQKAEAEVQCLGGSNLKPDGGNLFKMVSLIAGWKLAKQAQKLAARKGAAS